MTLAWLVAATTIPSTTSSAQADPDGTGAPRAEETQTLTEEEWMNLLPDDDAKVLVATYCAMCHSLKNAVLGARDRDEWLGTIEKMVLDYNAPIDAVDVELIADYLGTYSGPDNPIAVLPLELDSVSAAALDRLPFLTDAEVEAVLEFRATEGPVEDVAELRTVLGQDKLAKLRRYVTAR